MQLRSFTHCCFQGCKLHKSTQFPTRMKYRLCLHDTHTDSDQHAGNMRRNMFHFHTTVTSFFAKRVARMSNKGISFLDTRTKSGPIRSPALGSVVPSKPS